MLRTMIAIMLLAGSTAAAQTQGAAATPPPESAAKPKPGLSLAQIERLLSIGSPDEMVADLIKERGVAADIDREILGQLQGKGAGNRTIQALKQYLPKAAVVITGPAGAEVLINWNAAGNLDQTGAFTKTGLEPAHYTLEVRQDRYLPWKMETDLAGGKTSSFTAKLTPAFGQLTLKSLVAGARVTVDNHTVNVVAGTPLELSVGTHRVTILARLYSPYEETVSIAGGETSEIDPHLTPDQAQLNIIRARAVQSSSTPRFQRQVNARAIRTNTTPNTYQSGNQAAILSALDAATIYLEFFPKDPAVLGSYATALYTMNRMDQFAAAATRALAAGGTLSFAVRHPHGDAGKIAQSSSATAAHPATLTIQSDRIGYSSSFAFKCPVRTVSRPPSAYQLVDADRDVLGLRFADPAKPKKLVKLDLTDPMGRIPALSQLVRLVIEGKVQ